MEAIDGGTNNLMTIEEMREHEWVVSWSGGKDSTTTIILMREYGIPIKQIIYVRMMYNDIIPATLPVMTDFVDRTIEKLEGWGYKVDVVKSLQTAEDLSNKVYKKSKSQDRNGKRYGITSFSRGRCSFTDIKQKTIESILPDSNAYQMIGYACDEADRTHRLGGVRQSVMVALGITEAETFDICRKHDMLSPLYDLGFPRDGCWFCPNVRDKQIEMLKTDYPELINEIDNMIIKSSYDISPLYKTNNWVKNFMGTRGFVPKPILKDENQISLFEELEEED